MHGLHPQKGPWDEPLPKHLEALAGQRFEHRCFLTEVRGDWSWQKKIWRFAKGCSWTGVRVCYLCGALSKSSDNADLYWTMTGSNWEGNAYNLQEFINERMPAQGICHLCDILVISLGVHVHM